MRTKFRRAAVALLLPSLAAVSLLAGGRLHYLKHRTAFVQQL